ncbi:MAG: HlyC/CorC family transporter [Rehaibacterium terrae]|uniref:HlyC/CorC family transporter n=1 Tax=Rehaibacterium terrae TaxID=1341696 RepID=UPI00391DDB18
MDEIPLSLLFGALGVLLLLSAFFSGSETALMSVNRYRLLHLADEGHRGARLAKALLEQPDRLIGLILLGNNFVNILASAVTTVAFIRIAGEAGVLIGTVFLTVVVLIFAEVAPKTLAAFRPERIAFTAPYVLWPLLKVSYPIVRVINLMANGVLRLLGHRGGERSDAHLSQDELRVLLEHGGSLIPEGHRRMFLNILALEEVRVEDIMVPRNELRGIDLDSDPDTLREELARFPYSRAIVYRGSIDQVIGILNLRSMLDLRGDTPLTPALIESRLRKPYFIPESTRLPQQLVEFQRQRRRLALVVDEYGDLVGLITLADILEEIVGEFTTEPKANTRRIEHQPDGSVLVDGRIAVHSLNRRLGWELPTEDANTLSGLIVSRLETLPQPGDELEIEGLHMRLELVRDNVIRLVRIRPQQQGTTETR